MAAYSMDLRTRVLRDSDHGMKADAVADKYQVSASWVRRLKQRQRESAHCGAARSNVGGTARRVRDDGESHDHLADGRAARVHRKKNRFLTQMCARFSPSRSAAPWEEAADMLVPANQR